MESLYHPRHPGDRELDVDRHEVSCVAPDNFIILLVQALEGLGDDLRGRVQVPGWPG